MEFLVLTKQEFQRLLEPAHAAVFNTQRQSSTDRCDYVLAVDIDGKLAGWVTVHEISGDAVYWQFGGAMPYFKNTRQVVEGYDLMLKKQSQVAKRVFTKIANTNYRMLKLAMSRGFKIVGVRNHNNETLVELVKEFT